MSTQILTKTLYSGTVIFFPIFSSHFIKKNKTNASTSRKCFFRVLLHSPAFKILGAKFHVSLLSIAQLFDFAKDLQREIYNE